VRITWYLAAAFMAIVVTAPARAQELDSGAGKTLDAQGARAQRRAMLEARLGQRVGEIVKQQLGLTDQQFEQVRQVNSRFEGRRRSLLVEERQIRGSLRTQVAEGDRADQKLASDLLDRMIRIQRERIDVVEAEQRELAGILTPVQRVKYAAIQEQLRRRAQQLRQRRARAAAGLSPDNTEVPSPR
jgi:hypothetical protein